MDSFTIFWLSRTDHFRVPQIWGQFQKKFGQIFTPVGISAMVRDSWMNWEQWHWLPPKLQRRGLVFKCKLVTMERVWWVTMERVWWVTMERVWWVTLAWANFIWICHVFWQVLVTIENYDVSTELIIIFIIELGIWVILACPNFIRSGDTFGGKWLL